MQPVIGWDGMNLVGPDPMGGIELWTPPRILDGGTAYVIGGGPSLRGFDFNLLAGRTVIGCNDAWTLGEQVCPYLLFGDESWWLMNRARVLSGYHGCIVSCAPGLLRGNDPAVNVMLRIPDGLGVGNQLAWNYSTGAAAINLAISMGAGRVYALGIDCGHGNDQPSHWHDLNTAEVTAYTRGRFITGFQALAAALPPGVEVVRVVGAGSAPLGVFPEISIDQFVEQHGNHRENAPTTGDSLGARARIRRGGAARVSLAG